MVGEAEPGTEDVRPGRPHPVGLPEDVVVPAQRLHALVRRSAGPGPDEAALEEAQEVLRLVPLRVVDRVAGGHDELERRTGHRAAGQPVHGPDRGVDGVRGERLLRPLDRHDHRVARVGELPVEELEPRRRLHVGELQVGDVGEDQQRAAAPAAAGAVHAVGSGGTERELGAHAVRLAVDDRDLAVVPLRAVAHGGTRAEASVDRRGSGVMVRGVGGPVVRVRHPVSCSALVTRTGSGRSVSRARVPAGYAPASDVGSWAIAVRPPPRSTVIRLTAPRNAVAMTVPTSGPSAESSVAAGQADRLRPHDGGGLAVRHRLVDERHGHPQHVRRSPGDLGRELVRQADELRDERRGGSRVHPPRGVELLELARPHDADAVGDGQGLLLVVGDEQRRDARPRAGRGGSRRAAGRAPSRRARTAARRAAAPSAGWPARGPARRAAAARRTSGARSGRPARTARPGRACRRPASCAPCRRRRAAAGRTRRSAARSCAGTASRPGRPSPCRACWSAAG